MADPHDSERRGEPPTLPLPSRWRLIVAATVIIGFLALLYQYENDKQKARDSLQAPAGGQAAPSPAR